MNGMPTETGKTCWICGSAGLRLVKEANYAELSDRAFHITDANYGVTGAIFECPNCGFRQCCEMPDVLSYYESMRDEDYEGGREERSVQVRKIIERARRYRARGRLLDIGAGTGMLVEQALIAGYEAEGVEPSEWSQKRAEQLGLPVHRGVFPQPRTAGPYDVITMIDVIEHVDDPVGLLREAGRALSPDGVMILVTPDVRSLAARLLGWRWWHYRVAHIGYFDRRTLSLAVAHAGCETVAFSRPSWYFSADYLFERVCRYLPRRLRVPPPRFLRRIHTPLNLLDSMLVVVRRARG